MSPYVLHIVILVLLAIALGEAWNIVGGWAGQYSLGHAAYFGIGAYGTLILMSSERHVPFWWGALASALLAVVVAIVIGAICFRLRGAYFVLASIAVAEICRLFALWWKPVTNGAEGLLVSDLPPLKLGERVITDFAGKEPFAVLALGLALLGIAVNFAVSRTKLGYYLQAIREDQDAAWSLGIPLALYKNIALALSAALAALVGALTAVYVGFIDPHAVLGLDVSVQAVLVCILGGIGTVWGPVAGAVVLVLLDEGLRAWLTQGHALIYGLLLMAAILFMPEGLVGLLRRRRRSVAARPLAEATK
jgi:branched-chain amino acid transport system permease protein